LVSATNRDLERQIERGAFRLDLYYRIAGCVFQTPPLGGRRQDVLPLVRHFLSKLLGRETPELDVHLREYLINREYPGNVRELYQLAQRIAARYSSSGPITVGDLPEEDRPACGVFKRAWPNEQFEKNIAEAVLLGTKLKEISQAAAQTAMRVAVELERGNIQRAATRLGVTDRAIQMRRAAGQLGRGAIDEASTEAGAKKQPKEQNMKSVLPNGELSRSSSGAAVLHQGAALATAIRRPAFATKAHRAN